MIEEYLHLADGKRIFVRYYNELQDAKTILYIHGGPGDNCENFNFAAHKLSEKFNVILFDQRGVLRSDRIPESDNLTVDMLVDDCEYIRKHYEISQINLIGHSYGGLIALLYAVKLSSFTESVIFENPCWSTIDCFKSILDKACELYHQMNKKDCADRLYKNIETCKTVSDYEELITEIPENIRDAVYSNKPWSDEVNGFLQFDNITNEQWENSMIHHKKIMLDEKNSQNFLELTKEIKCPKLLIRGELDPVVPYDFEKYFCNTAGGELIRISNCGHYIHTDMSEQFCKCVTGFLQNKQRKDYC